MRKWISVFLILFLLVGVALAGDVKKEDKDVLKDDSVTVDKTKETLKEIDKGIQVRDTSADIAKYDVLKEKDKITISKTDTVKDKKVEHTKTKLVMDEKTARSIDVDKDGKFGYLRKVNGQVVDIKVVTLNELTTGIDATFSEVIIDGFAGSYTKMGSSQNVSTNMSLGQSFNSSKTSALLVNISSTEYDDPYTEIAALNPVAWYKLDNTSGTTIIDSSGNGYNGVAYNGPIWVTGKHNNGMSFDGVNDYATTSAKPSNTSGTIFAWVITTDTQKSTAFLGSMNPTSNRTYISLSKTGKLSAGFGTQSSAVITSTISPVVGRWYLTELWWNASNIRFLVDNEVVYTGARSGQASPFNISIGALNVAGTYNTWSKSIVDNVIVFSAAVNVSTENKIYYDGLQQLQAKTNANATYSGYWNSTSNNPLTLPVSSLDGLISSIQFKVPQNVTQNGVTIYNYNQTVAPFTPTATIYFTQNTTLIDDSVLENGSRFVSIEFTPGANFTQATLTYDLNSTDYLNPIMDTNQTNATVSLVGSNVTVDAGAMTTGETKYFNVTVEPNVFIAFTPSDTTPYGVVNTPKTFTVNQTNPTNVYWYLNGSLNQTNTSVTSCSYIVNSSSIGTFNVTAISAMDSQTWILTVSEQGFVNVPAVAVVVVITSVIGGSFINAWYRRRKNN